MKQIEQEFKTKEQIAMSLLEDKKLKLKREFSETNFFKDLNDFILFVDKNFQVGEKLSENKAFLNLINLKQQKLSKISKIAYSLFALCLLESVCFWPNEIITTESLVGVAVTTAVSSYFLEMNGLKIGFQKQIELVLEIFELENYLNIKKEERIASGVA